MHAWFVPGVLQCVGSGLQAVGVQSRAGRCTSLQRAGVGRVSQGRRTMRHHRAVGLLPRSDFIHRSMFVTEGPLPCLARQPCPGSELAQVAGA